MFLEKFMFTNNTEKDISNFCDELRVQKKLAEHYNTENKKS
jgi:hypothetical protein